MTRPNSKELQATLTACIPLLLTGVDVSFAADVDGLIPSKLLTIGAISLIGSINFYARVLGSIAAGYIVNKIGRKNSMLVSFSLSTTAWLIMTYFSGNIEIITASRIFSGLAAGQRSVSVLYISEISHKNRRGKLLACGGLATSCGVTITYFLQYFFAPKMVAVFSLTISIFGFIQAISLPETKYYLLMRNKPEEAQLSMLWFDDTMSVKEAREEIEEIQIQQQRATRGAKSLVVFKRWSNLKRFIICLLIYFIRAGSFRIPLVAYPHEYYKFFRIPISTANMSLIQGILEIIFATLNLFMADTFSRKHMLYACCWMMNTCLIIAFFQNAIVDSLGLVGEWLLLFGLAGYTGLSCGFLMSLTMIMISEIASTITEVRGIIISVGQVCNNLTNGFYASTFLFLLASVPFDYILLFMFTNLATLSIIITLVPETVGKALHKCDWDEQTEQKECLLYEAGEPDLQKFEDDRQKLYFHEFKSTKEVKLKTKENMTIE